MTTGRVPVVFGSATKRPYVTHDFANSQPLVLSGRKVLLYPYHYPTGLGKPGLPDFDTHFEKLLRALGFAQDNIIRIRVDSQGFGAPFTVGGEVHCLTNVVRIPLPKHK